MIAIKADPEESYSRLEDVIHVPAQMNSADITCDIPSFESEARPYALPKALSQHFSVHTELGDGTISGICHSCGATLKFTSRATSNLITHLKRCDPNRYETYCQSRKCKRARRSSPTAPLSSVTNPSVFDNMVSPSPSPEIAADLTSETVDYSLQPLTVNNDFSKPIMKHFTMSELKSSGHLTARCLNCGADVKASVKASSNLITHLKRCSPLRFERYCRDRGGKRLPRYWHAPIGNLSSEPATHNAMLSINKGSDNDSRGNSLGLIGPGQTERPLITSNGSSASIETASHGMLSPDRTSSHHMFGSPQSKQRRMVKSLVLSSATDHVPYDTMLKPNVKIALAEADNSFIIPDLHTMNDVIIPLCAHKVEEKITSELQRMNSLYLRLVLWIDPNYVTHGCFQVSFINEEWQLVHRHLGNYATETKLKPSSFVSVIDDVMKRYKIRSKIHKILLDNTIPFADDNNFFAVTSQIRSKNLMDSEFSTLLSFMPKNIGSVTQRIRIVVAQALFCDDTLFSPIIVSLRKAINLIKALSDCVKAAQYLDRLLIDVSSVFACRCCISILKSVVLLLNNFTHFKSALDFMGSPLTEALTLTGAETEILKEVAIIFNPLLESMKPFENGKLCAITPVVKRLFQSLDSVQTCRLRHCAVLLFRVKDLAKYKLESFLTYDDVAVASFLDPRFKLSWVETESDKDALLMKVTHLLDRSQPADQSFGDVQSRSAESHHLINAACQFYLSEPVSPVDTDPLLYWKCCHTTLMPLSILAREVLVCVNNSPEGETLDDISAWENCYRVFVDVQLRRNLFSIDRNKELFQSSL